MDWKERYRQGSIPWDLGRAHPVLVARLERGDLSPREGAARALVPGCGRGHDALALARNGWQVTAVDIVPDLEEELGSRLAPLHGRYVVEDALGLEDEPFDLLWDHTFFCAIEPTDRAAFGAMARRLLRKGGHLASIVFPVGKSLDEGGPPWGVSTFHLSDALRGGFELVEDDPVEQGAAEREGLERWALFERV